jgi:hypothetical protein
MEQLGESLRAWVDAGEIRAFVMVAVVAGKGKVGKMIAAAMLLGNDVLGVKRRKGGVGFGETTILTPIPRALSDLPAYRGVHQTLVLLRRRRALD